MAYRQINDLDRAKENLELAIQLMPSDQGMRVEHKKLMAEKSSKEKEWYSKMTGFYGKQKLSQIESRDEEEIALREKLKRQMFTE